MKYVDVKIGMRVIVTHHSSKDKGKTGTIVKKWDYASYAEVKLDGGIERVFHCGSINPAPAAKSHKSAAEPLTADDIVVGTELIYKGGLPYSGRRVGDVYVVSKIKYAQHLGNDGIWYAYKSGAKPNPSWEYGRLNRYDILKHWEIAS